ncbi:hypothetical protein PUN28_013214 [Cardiocondyla obscurior]|uniref:Uncharacterized protein n=1 Tax=Cardiocondyla obscurior TaxID=286306 RepID=A0AAW2F9I0_9HYME
MSLDSMSRIELYINLYLSFLVLDGWYAFFFYKKIMNNSELVRQYLAMPPRGTVEIHICIAPSPKFPRDILDPPKKRD